MKKYDLKDGVWRTIGGRRVFIRTGQSLSDAMKESGKFKQGNRREVQQAIAENKVEKLAKKNTELYKKYGGFADTGDKEKNKEVDKYHKEWLNNAKTANELKDMYNDYSPLGWEKDTYNNPKEYDGDLSKLEGKHIAGQKDRALNSKPSLYEETHGLYTKEEEDYISQKNQETKSIHTQSGSYTQKELKDRDESVKQMYKDAWDGKTSYKELHDNLEKMKSDGKISEGELRSLQYDASNEARQNETAFVQQVDMHGGTREYTKEDLDRMENAGVKPMEHSYTGGGWEGVNSRKNLSTSEQAKAITDTMREKYPDVKIARKSDVYSMGSSIDFNIMSSVKDMYISEKDIDNMTDFGRLSVGMGFENWAERNVEGFKRYTNETYTLNDVRRYAKEALNNIKSHEEQNVRGDEWYLSDYGKKVVSDLNKEADSYTYSDSDAMVDYFDHGTYMHISIGKWNKPYEVSRNESDFKKLYQQYKKEHKGSNISLDDFKKWFK